MVGESDEERLDPELIKLLNELRVVLPCVQVLFAFLLLLLFQQAFPDISPLERSLQTVAFTAAAATSILPIALRRITAFAFGRCRSAGRSSDSKLLPVPSARAP